MDRLQLLKRLDSISTVIGCLQEDAIVRTLDALGPMHGYGIARRIEQISQDLLQIERFLGSLPDTLAKETS